MVDRAAAVLERGYTHFDGLFTAEQVAPLAEWMRGDWRRMGAPDMVSREDVVIEPGVHVSPVGLTRSGILARLPALGRLLVDPRLLALFEALLGPGFVLEQSCGVISDEARPFFFWHHHVGGIDAEDYRRKPFPRYERVERVVCTIYASPLDDAHGIMQIWPRPAVGPTDPPFDSREGPWPGATELRASAGSVVVFDQGTWHAVTAMRQPGQRCFFGFFVRRGDLPPTERRDASVAEAFAADTTLARAFGGAA